ncbi:MAG: gfo/Idh/MocA family oxidoreductase, partial [Verrucomicrobiales bacterium]|nr:gfo/Idh/MocA family oxidoreductase [Verrucomicrobiales bacterium]
IGGGQLLDWIGHHCDIAHWGMDWDNTGPVEVEGHGEFPPRDAVWNTSTKYRIECLYPDGTPVTIAGGHNDIKGGTKWIGENGWVHVNRGQYDASNEDWKQKGRLPKELRGDVELLDSPGHHRNFLDCVKSRQKTITPVEAAPHSAVPGHLGLISMMLGRAIKWDPVKEVIANDPEATKLLGRDYQNGYKLPTA